MTVNDLKKGDRYKYTEKWINANPWCARGIYTHQGDYSDYEPTRSDPSYIDLKVPHRSHGHMYCEVELVI
ncbi:MAG: hypothetical protein ACRC6V_05075 [Bacteroidales bacterium]